MNEQTTGQDAGSDINKAAEIIRKTALAMTKGKVNGSTPSADEIAEKAIAALKAEAGDETISMDQVKELIAEMLAAKADDSETKPGAHSEDEMKSLKAEIAELKVGIKNLDDAMAKKRSDAMGRHFFNKGAEAAPGADKVIAACTDLKFKTGPAPSELKIPGGASRWLEYPTRAGLSEAAGFNLVRKAGESLETKLVGADEQKATALTTTAIPGAPVDGLEVWRTMLDPGKISPLCRIVRMLTGSSFKITRIRDTAFSSRTAVDPASNPSSAANALTEDEVNIKEFYNSFPVSDATLEDNTGIPSAIAEGFAQQYMKTLDEECFTVIKSEAAAGQKVNTGAATGLPTAATMFQKLVELRKTVAMPYRGNGVFLINSDVEELLLANFEAGEGYAWNPFQEGPVHQLLGAKVVVVDRLDDTTTPQANEVCAAFGQWDKAIVIGERIALTVWEQFYQPGFHLWASRFRVGVGVESKDAFSILQVGA